MIRIRRTTDIETVLALDAATFLYDARVIPQPHDLWWLATDGDALAGFCGLRVYSNGYGYLCRAGVLPACRGRGIQRRMIAVRVAEARRRGLRHLLTDTRSYNLASSNSLIAYGFRLYRPEEPWAFLNSLYWRLDLDGRAEVRR